MLVAPPIILREEGGFLSEQISVRGQYHFKSLFLGVIRTREANQRLLAKVNIHRHHCCPDGGTGAPTDRGTDHGGGREDGENPYFRQGDVADHRVGNGETYILFNMNELLLPQPRG
jgi:hypothetical protein